ncbi:uncharacterized protein LOC117125143 [Anneissia japonica]|uniref:uncharacterized protein LOC117125143 n=1 Tax=Anneissia japonica TaxID=1529436 RepID=UPI0014255691|nr:uncharacterized protein LOC117125143 [Anneissia japonica]
MLFKYSCLRFFFMFFIFWKWNFVKGMGFESCHFNTSTSFVMCDCSNLGLTGITEPLRADVTVLILRNNSLQTISADVFVEASNLRHLDLSHNQLTSIQENTFSNLPKLRRLYLSNNLIISFDSSSLRNLQNLKVLQINDNRLSAIPNLNDLSALLDLQLQGNSLNSIIATDFQVSRKLQYLDLSRNQIHSIGVQVFGNMNNLVHLNLSRNQLRTLDPATFERQVSLEGLDIAYNCLRTFNLTIFNGLSSPKIKVLNLTGNDLYSLPSNLFERLEYLTNLQVADNNIQAWKQSFFYYATTLEVLNLAGNSLDNLDKNMFSRQQRLRVLNLSRNRIEDVKESLLDIMTLESLDLSSNNIRKLPTNLLSAPLQLKEIFLSGNLLNSTPEFAFYLNLEIIRLDENRITGMYNGDFDKLRMLTQLDLSKNYIREVQVDAFSGATSLTSINLRRNELQTLPTELFRRLQQLVTLDLRENLWQCDCVLFDFLQSLPNMLELVASSEVLCRTPPSLAGQPIDDSVRELCSGVDTQIGRNARTIHVIAITVTVVVVIVGFFSVLFLRFWIKHKGEKDTFQFGVPSQAQHPTTQARTGTLPLPPSSEDDNVQNSEPFPYYLSIDTLRPDAKNQYDTIQRMPNQNMFHNNGVDYGTDGYLSASEIGPSHYTPMSNIYLQPKKVTAQNESKKTSTMANAMPNIEDTYLQRVPKAGWQTTLRRWFDFYLIKTFSVISWLIFWCWISIFQKTLFFMMAICKLVVLFLTLIPVSSQSTGSSCKAYSKLSGTYYNCSGRGVRSIPMNIPYQTETLLLKDNAIKQVRSNVFVTLTNLHSLDLSNNRINNIQMSGFLGLTNLQILNLSGNSLVQLPVELFRPIRGLETLILSNNRIEYIQVELFKDLAQLTTLDLSNNRIKKIHDNTFSDLIHLQELYLQSNSISTLTDNTLNGLLELELLYMKQNKLLSISSEFQLLTRLKFLDLGGNFITTIDPDAFNNFGRLTELGLENNNLSSVPRAVGQSSSLQLTLRELYLGNNPIREVPDSAFGRFTYLEDLQLDHMKLSELNVDAFKGMPKLRHLWLNSNKLKTIQKETIIPLRHLLKLQLDENYWNCDCSLFGLVQYLDQHPELNAKAKGEIPCHTPLIRVGQPITTVLELSCDLESENFQSRTSSDPPKEMTKKQALLVAIPTTFVMTITLMLLLLIASCSAKKWIQSSVKEKPVNMQARLRRHQNVQREHSKNYGFEVQAYATLEPPVPSPLPTRKTLQPYAYAYVDKRGSMQATVNSFKLHSINMHKKSVLSISVIFLILKFSINFPMIESQEFEVLTGSIEVEVCSLNHRLEFCFNDVVERGSSSKTSSRIHFNLNPSIEGLTKHLTIRIDMDCKNCDLLNFITKLPLVSEYETNFTECASGNKINSMLGDIYQDLIGGDSINSSCCWNTNSSTCWNITCKELSRITTLPLPTDPQRHILAILVVVIAIIVVISIIAIFGVYRHGKRMIVELENDTQHRSRIQPGSSMPSINMNMSDESTDLEDSGPVPMAIEIVEPSKIKPTSFAMIGNPLSRKRSVDSNGYAVPDVHSIRSLNGFPNRNMSTIEINSNNVQDGFGNGHMPVIPEDEDGYLMPNQQSHQRKKVIGYFTRVPSDIDESDA